LRKKCAAGKKLKVEKYQNSLKNKISAKKSKLSRKNENLLKK
jgi:hypothetical protein